MTIPQPGQAARWEEPTIHADTAFDGGSRLLAPNSRAGGISVVEQTSSARVRLRPVCRKK